MKQAAKMKSLDGGKGHPCLQIPHGLIRRLGPVTAMVAAAFMEQRQLLLNDPRWEHRVRQNGYWFPFLQSRLGRIVGITPRNIRPHISKLEAVGLLDVERRGVPPAAYYRLNDARINQLIADGRGLKDAESEGLGNDGDSSDDSELGT